MGSGASSSARGSASAAATDQQQTARPSILHNPGAGVGDIDQFSDEEYDMADEDAYGGGTASFRMPFTMEDEVDAAHGEAAQYEEHEAKGRMEVMSDLIRSRVFPPPVENYDPFKEFTAQWVVGFKDDTGPLADMPATKVNEDGEEVALSEAERLDLAEKKAEETRQANLAERREFQEREAARKREQNLQCRAHILWLRGRSRGANMADPKLAWKPLPRMPTTSTLDLHKRNDKKRSDSYMSWWRVAPVSPTMKGVTFVIEGEPDDSTHKEEPLWRGDFVRHLRFTAEARGMPLACISLAAAAKHIKSVKGFAMAIKDHREAVSLEGVYQLWSPAFVGLLEEVRVRTGSLKVKMKEDALLEELGMREFPFDFQGSEALCPPPPPVPEPEFVSSKHMHYLKKEGFKRLREHGELPEADHPTRPTFIPGEQPPLPDYPLELAKCLGYTSPVDWFKEPWKESPAYAEAVEMTETERRPQPKRRPKITIADLI